MRERRMVKKDCEAASHSRHAYSQFKFHPRFQTHASFFFSFSVETTLSVAEVYHRGAESWRMRRGGGLQSITNLLQCANKEN